MTSLAVLMIASTIIKVNGLGNSLPCNQLLCRARRGTKWRPRINGKCRDTTSKYCVVWSVFTETCRRTEISCHSKCGSEQCRSIRALAAGG